MKLHESGEMYLETILILSQTQSQVRSVDIAMHMNYSKPSVSRAVHLLEKENYIHIDKNGFIFFTETGLEKAEKIYERHNVLSKFFTDLGVDADTAAKDACAIEHVISNESFYAIKRFLKK